MLDYNTTQQRIDFLFKELPDLSTVGYECEVNASDSQKAWKKSFVELAEIDDFFVQEEIFDNIIMLFPCMFKEAKEHNRFYCTVALQYYNKLANSNKLINERLSGAYRKMHRWEDNCSDSFSSLKHHYKKVLEEYISYIQSNISNEKKPPYIDNKWKVSSPDHIYQRLFYESDIVGRELYCDLWYPNNKHTDIICYHITGFSSKKEQEKRRYTIPDNFTECYGRLIKKYTGSSAISFCLIPCPYEEIYPHFINQVNSFFCEVLFPSVENISGYTSSSSKRGLSAFSRGSHYLYSLVSKKPVSKAIITNSGAVLEKFTEKIIAKELQLPDIRIKITCGTNDSLFRSNEELHNALNDIGILHEFEIHNGAHDWKDVEPVFENGLSWLVGQLE